MDASLPAAPLVQFLAGLLVLVLGRRLFWVFVGVVGFFFGLRFGAGLFAGLADWQLLLLCLLAGVVCAGLTILLQRLAVAIAGGLAGGMIGLYVAPSVGLLTTGGQQVAFVTGALLAAVLLSVLFDPVLIALSAIVGASMMADALPLDAVLEPLVFGILFVIGVVAQVRLGAAGRRPA